MPNSTMLVEMIQLIVNESDRASEALKQVVQLRKRNAQLELQLKKAKSNGDVPLGEEKEEIVADVDQQQS